MEIQQDLLIAKIESVVNEVTLSELRIEREKIWNYYNKLKAIIEFKEKLSERRNGG